LSRTEVIGGRPREVRATLDPEALAAHGLGPLDVARALGAADAALTAGAFDRADRRLAVVAGPFVGTQREAEGLVVGAFAGRPVHLRDVATVVDGPREATAHVRLTFGAAGAPPGVPPGRSFPAVTLAFAKKRGTNAVRVAEDLLKRAETLEATILPADVHVLVTRNYGETANEKVNELLRELGLAIVTVTGLVAFALGWREGLIVAAAVPITFALTLLVNLLAGYTVNRVTLFAARREPPLEAVVTAVNEVRPPVIVATLAVMISFLPMFFITGMMGPYMRPMALNVPVAMAMSLLVAFTVTPWMAYRALGTAHGRETAHPADDTPGAFLDRRAARRGLVAALLALFALAVVLLASGAIPLKMLPYDNKSELELVLDLPAGATLEATDALVRDVERYLATVPEVTDYEAYVGTASPIDFNGLVRRYGLRQAPHLADVRVNLVPKSRRVQQSHAIGLRLRRDLEALAAQHEARLKIVEVPPGPPVLETLVAEVRGPADRPYDTLVTGAR